MATGCRAIISAAFSRFTAASASPSAWMILARRSRSASAWRAIARIIWAGRSTCFTFDLLHPLDLACSSRHLVFLPARSPPLMSPIGENHALLNMTGMSRDAHVRDTQKCVCRDVVNFNAIALLQRHGCEEAL